MWMLDFPLLLVWVVALAVIGCVVGLAIYQTLKTGSLGASPVLLVGITVFGTSLLGYAVTAWGPLTPELWRQPFLVRVVWQLGGGILLAICTIWQTPPHRRRLLQVWLLALAWVVIALFMTLAPLADLMDGAEILTGKGYLEVDAERGPLASISAALTVTEADGHVLRIAKDGVEASTLCTSVRSLPARPTRARDVSHAHGPCPRRRAARRRSSSSICLGTQRARARCIAG